MTWSDFYLLCFIIGFLMSVFSLISGHLHLHWPHGDFHAPHGGGHAGHGATHGGTHAATGAEHGSGKSQVPWLNLGTIAAFLTWFGGSGYLATRYYSALVLTALGIAVALGLIGASVVFWFLAKVLMSQPEELDPADYDMVGVLGTVSGTIRIDGTGEILFSQEGARKCANARSEDGRPIPVGVEVVVTRFERGIAYVKRWDELTQAALPSGSNQ